MRDDQTDPNYCLENINTLENNIQSQIFSKLEYESINMLKESSEENNYPDLDATQPALAHNVIQNIINPKNNTPMNTYIENSITYIKDLESNQGTEIGRAHV